jgi:diguanylate cyclase (GGDEF)-like protein
VLRSRSPLILSRNGGKPVPFPLPELPEKGRWGEILGIPLLSRGRAIGAVELVRGPERPPFRRKDIRLLTLLLEPMAIAIENALLLRRSEELSITDDLTKLYNSRYLNSYLLREVQRSRRYSAKVSLIFLDLDGFKNVNDQHGHLAGSRALVEVGAVIRNMVREIDVVSRFGGDEFTVILPQTGPEGALVIAERMRRHIEETVFLETFGLKVRITASFGIACFPDHGQTKDALIQKADQAMYRVKGRGKNGVEMAD